MLSSRFPSNRPEAAAQVRIFRRCLLRFVDVNRGPVVVDPRNPTGRYEYALACIPVSALHADFTDDPSATINQQVRDLSNCAIPSLHGEAFYLTRASKVRIDSSAVNVGKGRRDDHRVTPRSPRRQFFRVVAISVVSVIFLLVMAHHRFVLANGWAVLNLLSTQVNEKHLSGRAKVAQSLRHNNINRPRAHERGDVQAAQLPAFKNSSIFLCSSGVRLARTRMCIITTSHCAGL